MINYKDLQSNPEKYKEASKAKNVDVDIDKLLTLGEQKLELEQKLQALRAEVNENAEIIKEKVAKSGGKPPQDLIDKGKDLKTQVKEAEEKLEPVKLEFEKLLWQVPNPATADTPVGKNEDENVVLRKWGEIRDFDAEGFEPKNHLELGEELGLIDFEAGAKVTGSQFYFLKNEAVLLEQAVMQFGMKKLRERGYELIVTPDLAKSEYYLGTGYNPQGDEAQIYEIEGEDLGLIATAEITMAGYHADELMEKDDLPKRYAAISHCYRKEAGAYGKYSKGLYRVHQFSKLEMFVYCREDQSEEFHQELIEIEEEIFQELGIPYHVLQMCTGDLGAIAAKKYDLEAWMPGRGDYGEVTSASIVNDYQARRLNIRYRDGDENKYAHMLNGTAVVSSRVPIAILENYQTKEGEVEIPEVLQPYMFGIKKIEKK